MSCSFDFCAFSTSSVDRRGAFLLFPHLYLCNLLLQICILVQQTCLNICAHICKYGKYHIYNIYNFSKVGLTLPCTTLFLRLNYPTLVSDQFQTFNFRKRTFSPREGESVTLESFLAIQKPSNTMQCLKQMWPIHRCVHLCFHPRSEKCTNSK